MLDGELVDIITDTYSLEGVFLLLDLEDRAILEALLDQGLITIDDLKDLIDEETTK